MYCIHGSKLMVLWTSWDATTETMQLDDATAACRAKMPYRAALELLPSDHWTVVMQAEIMRLSLKCVERHGSSAPTIKTGVTQKQ